MKICKGHMCHAVIYPIPDKSKKSKRQILPYSKAESMGFLTGISSFFPTKENPEDYCPSCKRQLAKDIEISIYKPKHIKKIKKVLGS